MAEGRSKRWTLDALVSMLAPAVGAERARASVLSALASLGLAEQSIDEDSARRVFQFLQGAGGLTGIASRRALATMSIGEDPEPATPEPLMRAMVNADITPARGLPAVNAMTAYGSAVTVTRADIVDLLAHAVGKSVAESAVERASVAVGFGAVGTVQSAMRVLETIAQEPGLVGITARFAKARLALRGK